jgi:hypothetical protein
VDDILKKAEKKLSEKMKKDLPVGRNMVGRKHFSTYPFIS